jgi:bis(5'-nucleosyl)-tetraphosphatase (symmetrical)
MSTYAIGDIQGCYQDLQALLQLIQFDPIQDTLWFTGDLVNRGPNSLQVLRFIKSLNERAIVVLGNHDIHLLAVAENNVQYLKPQDTLGSILSAYDREELLEWLRNRPLLHHDSTLGFTMIHAGLPPQWNLQQASECAKEVEQALSGEQYKDYLANVYGNKPKKWSEELEGWERLRFITNCFTRLRYCSAKGKLALKKKDSPSFDANEDKYQPWFLWSHRASREQNIIFGHWSTLGYYADNGVYALDTGCLWGGSLTALRLEDKQVFSLPCAGACDPRDFHIIS